MKKINENLKKGMSVALAAALVCSGAGVVTYAKGREEQPQKTAVQEKEVQKIKAEASAELSEKDKEELSKNETVYVIANADGSTQKLIVSDWLKNAMNSTSLTDTTQLTDITNVKGDETFEKESGDVTVWDAEGNDIYYQGNITKELPVDMKITYTLDGKTVSPEELAGQSGQVTIRFDYTNRQKEKVETNGKTQELYVPFVIATAFVTDNDHFKNIEVTNGKVINDGDRSIVMGCAMPGLKDNLEIGSDEIDLDEVEIPDYVEVKGEAEDFELAATMSVATSEIFGDLDIDAQSTMDDLSSDMDELTDAMAELMDGTSELYDGVLELYDGTEELYDGIDDLDSGAGKLNTGAGDLYDGTKSLYDGAGALKSGAGQLILGAQKLAAGLTELDGKSPNLTAGAQQLSEGLLTSLNTKIKQANTLLAAQNLPQLTELDAENYASQIQTDAQLLDQIIAGLQTKMNQIQGMLGTTQAETKEMESEDAVAKEKVESEEVQQSVEAQQNTEEQQGEETQQNTEVQQGTETQQNTETQQGTETQQSAEAQQGIDAEQSTDAEQSVDADTPQAEVQAKEIPAVQAAAGGAQAALVKQLLTLQQAIDQLSVLKDTLTSMGTMLGGLGSLSQGIAMYTQGVAALNAGAQEIMKNIPALNTGVNSLVDGAGKLKDGAGELKDGTGELKDGTGKLKDGGKELKDGVEELRDGSKELKDGVVEFDEEGIQKLVDIFDGDVQELVDRFEGSKEAAQAYKSFSGIADGMQGSVKFVYKTEAIEAK